VANRPRGHEVVRALMVGALAAGAIAAAALAQHSQRDREHTAQRPAVLKGKASSLPNVVGVPLDIQRAAIAGVDVYWDSITSPNAKTRIASARSLGKSAVVGLTRADSGAQLERASSLISHALTGDAAALQRRNTAMVLSAAVRHPANKATAAGSQPSAQVIADVYTGGGIQSYKVLSSVVSGRTAHLSLDAATWCDDVVYFADGTSEDQPSRGVNHYELDLILVDGVWKVSKESVDVLG